MQTNGQGDYFFRALPPATYKMVIEAKGFGTVEQDKIVLTVNQQATLNTTLKPASESINVTVHAIPVLLDSARCDAGDRREQHVSRADSADESRLVRTDVSGGRRDRGDGSGTQDSYPSGTNFVSNGQRNATADIRLDGDLLSAPEQGEGGTTNVYYQPSVEALQEFKVENNSFSAEYGTTAARW